MTTPICRLLPYTVADGPHNMAADETLLHSATTGVASLRFYGWSSATLSLGYFQPERLRKDDLLLADLPFVRRPSGGDTLVHRHELTYALALPPGPPWQAVGESWLTRMHQLLAEALAELGVSVQSHPPLASKPIFVGPLCFRHHTTGDLLFGPHKVVGSAQRRQRGAILQHGAILLRQSSHTPILPGIWELTGRDLSLEELQLVVRQAFARQTGWPLELTEWTAVERRQTFDLVAEKYTRDSWNRKR